MRRRTGLWRRFVGSSLPTNSWRKCVNCLRTFDRASRFHTDCASQSHVPGSFIREHYGDKIHWICACCASVFIGILSKTGCCATGRLDLLLDRLVRFRNEQARIESREACAICLDAYFSCESTFLLPCNHSFCSSEHCRDYLKSGHVCPLCRAQIVSIIVNNVY